MKLQHAQARTSSGKKGKSLVSDGGFPCIEPTKEFAIGTDVLNTQISDVLTTIKLFQGSHAISHNHRGNEEKQKLKLALKSAQTIHTGAVSTQTTR